MCREGTTPPLWPYLQKKILLKAVLKSAFILCNLHHFWIYLKREADTDYVYIDISDQIISLKYDNNMINMIHYVTIRR